MAYLLERVVVPVATTEDAEATAEALNSDLPGEIGEVLGIHVIEKGGGAPDKAPLAAREADAEAILATLSDTFEGASVSTRTVYGTDVVEAIVDVVEEVDATAVAFCPRPAGTLTRLLTGDRARSLLETSPVPVVSLPVKEGEDG